MHIDIDTFRMDGRSRECVYRCMYRSATVNRNCFISIVNKKKQNVMLKYIYIYFAACVRRVNAKKNGKFFFY